MLLPASKGEVMYSQRPGSHAFASTYRDHQVLGQFVAERSNHDDLVITMGPEPVALYFSRRNGWV